MKCCSIFIHFIFIPEFFHINPCNRSSCNITINSLATDIDLSNQNLGDKDLINVLCILNPEGYPNTTLKRLNLSNNNIGYRGAQRLGVFLNNSNLLFLNLDNNNIGDEGLIKLSEGFANGFLQEISLKNNNIGNHGVRIVSLFIDDNTTLTVIDLSENLITFVEHLKHIETVLNNNSKKFIKAGKKKHKNKNKCFIT